MKTMLDALGVLLVVNGVTGLLHEGFGWPGAWSLVHWIGGPLAGMEIFGSLVLVMLGVAVWAGAERIRRPG